MPQARGTALVRRLDRALCTVEDVLIVVLTLTGLAMAFLQVVLRYVFNTGIHWLEAALVTALIWAMLIGASRAVREKIHPRVDLVPLMVSRRVRAVLNVLALAATTALVVHFLADAVFYGRFLARINVMHPELGIRMIWPFLIIPVATGLITLRYALLAWALWFEPGAHIVEDSYLARIKGATEGAETGK